MSGSDQKMEMLRERFHRRAASDRAEIVVALRQGDFPQLLRLAHGLAGIAAIFGYQEVSVQASALEDGIEREVDGTALANLGGALIAALDEVGGSSCDRRT